MDVQADLGWNVATSYICFPRLEEEACVALLDKAESLSSCEKRICDITLRQVTQLRDG
jgi:hypothetical protein